MTNRYYKKFDIVKSADGVEYYQSPNWMKADFDGVKSREIIWEEGDRLDVLVQQIYGDPDLYKVIALFNGIGDVLAIQPGQIVYFPLKIKDVLDRL